MWLFTTIGFFSAVSHRDKPGVILLRARFRDDIHRLAARYGLDPDSVSHTPNADYAWRVELPQPRWAAIVKDLAERIDYDNFKNAAHTGDPVRDRAMLDAWAILRRAQQTQERQTSASKPPAATNTETMLEPGR